jgi:hypothetical protein
MGGKLMPNQIHHGGYPIGSVDYVPKSFKRRGAFIRYIAAGDVIWLLKPDVESYFAQLDRREAGGKPEPTASGLGKS